MADSKEKKSGAATYFKNFSGKLDNLRYKNPTKTKAKTQVVYFGYGGGNLRLQLALKDDHPIHAPFGVSKFVADDATEEDRLKAENDPRQNCDLSLNTSDLVQFFQELDEHNIQVAIANKAKWFTAKKDPPRDEVIRDNYKCCVMVDPEQSYPPRLRVKVNMATVKVIEYIPPTEPGAKGSYKIGNINNYRRMVGGFDCIPICEPSAIWFQNASWGCTIMATDLLIYPAAQKPEFGFEWDSESVPENVDRMPPPMPKAISAEPCAPEVCEPSPKRARTDGDSEGDDV